MDKLRRAVEVVFNNWTALEMAAHQSGAMNSTCVILYTIDEIMMTLRKAYRNSSRCFDEDAILTLMEDMLDHNFDTICEDNSPYEIVEVLSKLLGCAVDGGDPLQLPELKCLSQGKNWLPFSLLPEAKDATVFPELKKEKKDSYLMNLSCPDVTLGSDDCAGPSSRWNVGLCYPGMGETTDNSSVGGGPLTTNKVVDTESGNFWNNECFGVAAGTFDKGGGVYKTGSSTSALADSALSAKYSWPQQWDKCQVQEPHPSPYLSVPGEGGMPVASTAVKADSALSAKYSWPQLWDNCQVQEPHPSPYLSVAGEGGMPVASTAVKADSALSAKYSWPQQWDKCQVQEPHPSPYLSVPGEGGMPVASTAVKVIKTRAMYHQELYGGIKKKKTRFSQIPCIIEVDEASDLVEVDGTDPGADSDGWEVVEPRRRN